MLWGGRMNANEIYEIMRNHRYDYHTLGMHLLDAVSGGDMYELVGELLSKCDDRFIAELIEAYKSDLDLDEVTA